jgi:hypothetical protein
LKIFLRFKIQQVAHGNGINQTRQQPMNSGLLVLSVLLFVAGVTLISIG